MFIDIIYMGNVYRYNLYGKCFIDIKRFPNNINIYLAFK